MPDTEIERTIYKLELDGSAYVDGVEKAAAGTKKLSEAQEAANAKLTALKTEQANYTKQIAEVTGVLKANETETLNLSKRYNEVKDRITAINTSLKQLKDNFKGNSTEAKVLQAELKTLNNESKTLQSQMKAITINTKEFRIEQTALKTGLSQTNTAVKATTKEIAALEAGTGNFTKGLTKAYSGLRVLANIIPGIGIGGLVALIAGPLVSALSDWAEGLVGVTAAQKQVNEIVNRSADTYGKAVSEVSEMTTKIRLAKEGFLDKNEVLKEYNDTIGKTVGHTNDLDKAEQLLIQHGPDYIKLLTLKAQAQAAGELAAESAKQQLVDENAGLSLLQKILVTQTASRNQAINAKAKQLGDDAKTTEDYLKRQQDLLEEAARFAKEHQLNFTPTPNPKDTQKGIKDVVNIYAQELQKLKADIAKLDEKGFTDEAAITKAVEEDFKIRSQAYEKAFKNKQLTAGQLQALQGYLKDLEKLTLDTQLKSFRESKQAYLQAINDEITSLQFEESTKRIAAIQDNFERERQIIIAETDKTLQALEQKRDQKLKEIVRNASAQGLTKEQIQPQLDEIEKLYSKLFDDLQVIKNQKLQQLSFETFEALTEDAKRALDAENLGISQGSLFRIKQQAELFQQGKISFKEYQESLTAIAKTEENERFEVQKAFLEKEIALRQQKLDTDKTLTSQQTKQLRDEIVRLQQQLTDAEKGNITSNTKTDTTKDALSKFNDYANAIKSLTDSIISFWQQSNAAEQQALERSIALQETRVDAATRIAERGNAEYLKAEQDRLDQLNVARENAARKQLGIDAALQASQILVGITGAISKIATPGIGPAETIAEIAIIIGALATGYGLVKSLQGNQPRLYKGTKYLDRNGAPTGRDTIPVMANEGEAVIPTDINKEYHPAVSAIYDRTIPAEELNRFVTTYHKIKPVPQINHELIKEAAMIHVEHDGKMSVLLQDNNKKLDEHIELQKMTLNAMRKMGISATIDRNGVAIMVNEYLQKLDRDKKI